MTCKVNYRCCYRPIPHAHLFPPSVCSTCWCAFGDRCRPSRANIYFNSLIFSSISLKYSHRMCSVCSIISSRFHRTCLCDMYEPIFICFELCQIVSHQRPTAGKHWLDEGFLDVVESCATTPLTATLWPFFYCVWHNVPNPAKGR